MENLQEILKKVYKVSAYKPEYYNKTQFSPIYNETYGEVTQESTNAIISHFSSHFNKDTVFYDLGCGLGKMVVHVGLQCNPKKSCGVELSRERIQAGRDMKRDYCPNNDNIEFILGDMFRIDISDATVIYLDNTAMDGDIVKKIVNKIPKGCLLICRRLNAHCTDIPYEKLFDDKLATTYFKKYVYHLIK